MIRVKSILATLALAVSAAFAMSPAAIAQGTNVVVIDRVQIFGQSQAGQDIRTKIQAIETQMQSELKPLADSLTTDGTSLQAKSEGKTQEAVRADAALMAEIEAYSRKANDFERKRQIAAQELSLTERKALVDFNNALIPVLQQVIAETNANVILDKSQVVYVDDATDVTQSAITKLNASTPTVQVVRQSLPAQQPQQ
jgi:outer membrane protein